jgi:hypothetical protein
MAQDITLTTSSCRKTALKGRPRAAQEVRKLVSWLRIPLMRGARDTSKSFIKSSVHAQQSSLARPARMAATPAH